MARMTLRLPNSLHDAIAALADEDGVSLNHYVVYALTRAATSELAARQRAQFEALRSRTSREKAQAALDRLLAERADPAEEGEESVTG